MPAPKSVDDDERTGRTILGIGVERHRRRTGYVAEADVIERERISSKVLADIYVDLVLNRGETNGSRLGADADEVRTVPEKVVPDPSKARWPRIAQRPPAATLVPLEHRLE